MTVAPLWTTSADGDSADTTPMELEALREHAQRCISPRGRLAALRCAAMQWPGFLQRRLVTTLAVLVLLGAVLLAI